MQEAKKKELLFTVPKTAFRVDTFRSGGKGGQNQNKRDSGVRITHVESCAVGEARDERSQGQNKKNAFHRLVDSKKFQAWLKLKTALVMQGFRNLEEKIERMLAPDNLKVEVIPSYVCDGCGKKLVSMAIPPGWSFEPPDTHACQECQP